MPTLTYPGVYVQEVSSGVRPLEIASTSTAAFVGLAEMGPTDGATLITSWTEFLRRFGTFIDNSFLAHSVFQYFNNGGRQCYILRVTASDAATATVTLLNRASAPVAGVKFLAKNKGAWGNSLLLRIEDSTDDPGNLFKLTVRRLVDPANAPANLLDLDPLETFDNLGMDPAASNYLVDVLAQNSLLVDAVVLDTDNATQPGTHTGGAGISLPLTGAGVSGTSFQISVDSDGYQLVTLTGNALTSTDVDVVRGAIQTAVRALHPAKAGNAGAYGTFTCTVAGAAPNQQLVLTSGSNSATSSVRVRPAPTNDASALLKLGAAGRSQDGLSPRRPALTGLISVGSATVAPPVTTADAGANGGGTVNTKITDTTFSGAFPRLDTVTDVSLLAVPGEGTTAIFDLGTAYCANRPLQDVFYVGEMADHDDSVDDARTFRGRLTLANSYGALYFPWVKALDPTGRSAEPILLPPSGYLAGVYARTDSARGVWKAPAGTEASLNGVVGLAAELSDVEHGDLNPVGVDVIRRFTGVGVVAFGARTVTSDAEWRYVPVRRTAIMLRTSIYRGIQFAVFEPNDETLWAQLRLNINSFMLTLFRQGAFQGVTPAQAFFVKCDAETTTQADIDAGVVNVLVGFAPLKPAEFVVVKISQKAGLASG
jgi:phage tail sheath protein FI